MSSEQKKLSLKDLRTVSKQVLQDLRELQHEGKTLPDILYNYRLQEGRLVRKKKRAGSISGEEAAKEEMEEQKQKQKQNDVKESTADDVAHAAHAATTSPTTPAKPQPYPGTWESSLGMYDILIDGPADVSHFWSNKPYLDKRDHDNDFTNWLCLLKVLNVNGIALPFKIWRLWFPPIRDVRLIFSPSQPPRQGWPYFQLHPSCFQAK